MPCAAAGAAIQIIESEPHRREYLLRLASDFRRGLVDLGIETIPNATGPIVPVLLQSPDRAVDVARQLEQEGFLVAAIRPPTVPEGTSRLRITLSSGHQVEDVERLANALRWILKPAGA